MTPTGRTLIRQHNAQQGREYEFRVKVTRPMFEAFQMLSVEVGMSNAQHLRRMLRAYLAQNLIGYDD